MNPSPVRGGVQDAFAQTVPRSVTRVSPCKVHAKPLHLTVSAPQSLSSPTEKFSGFEGSVPQVGLSGCCQMDHSHSSLQLFTQDLASAPPVTGSLQSFRREMCMREMPKSFRSQESKAALADSLHYRISLCNQERLSPGFSYTVLKIEQRN